MKRCSFSTTVGMAAATVAVAAATLVSSAACNRPTPPVVLPSSMTMVAESSYVGGFVPFGYSLIDPPWLAVYSDGRVIAHAQRTLNLSQSELTELIAATRRDLSGLGPTVEAGAELHVADAPNTVLKILEADGQLRSVSAYALGIADGYPQSLVAADARFRALTERVMRDGTPYTGARIVLVAQERDSAGPQPILTWPA